MQIRQAQRCKAKIKMALTGPSGSGKTMSSLLIAYGLCGNWSKIAVIDTENNSADLYADLGPYQVLQLFPPFSTEQYISAIKACESYGLEVIIIDSITHEWEYILELHGNMAGNSYTNWHKVNPAHNSFVQTILQSSAHIISTIRSKQDYVLYEKNGKMVPEKVGMKSITREGMDYEFTLVFDLDMKNQAHTSKDRTGLFMGKPPLKISSATGTQILEWCNIGTKNKIGNIPLDFTDLINNCKSVDELLDLYMKSPEYQQSHLQEFTSQRQRLSQSSI
ncbi:AAA family ATPase [Chitinophaga polysaccharea]|uniref:AAA family ATPase n=1 Tax=Chitinophaga polysaccharea TaxID=1293035 RepID=UPI0014551B27|nr:AAA family ATPase [Chitinophaga polysaccharea]NLR58161.1 AAA family ATPase [Chitinophaga polysaccharea]